MGQTLNTEKKLCKVMTNGPIRELGNIRGPVSSPCRIDKRKVINMVQRGLKVYEVNPKNYAEEVLLTIQNVNKNNFVEAVVEKMKEVPAPVVEVKKEDVVEANQDNIGEEVKTETPDEAILTAAATAAVEAASVDNTSAPEALNVEVKKTNDFSNKKYNKK